MGRSPRSDMGRELCYHSCGLLAGARPAVRVLRATEVVGAGGGVRRPEADVGRQGPAAHGRAQVRAPHKPKSCRRRSSLREPGMIRGRGEGGGTPASTSRPSRLAVNCERVQTLTRMRRHSGLGVGELSARASTSRTVAAFRPQAAHGSRVAPNEFAHTNKMQDAKKVPRNAILRGLLWGGLCHNRRLQATTSNKGISKKAQHAKIGVDCSRRHGLLMCLARRRRAQGILPNTGAAEFNPAGKHRAR